jgi:hypothetical protein
MKISTVLDHIDSSHVSLPELQRGCGWSRPVCSCGLRMIRVNETCGL